MAIQARRPQEVKKLSPTKPKLVRHDDPLMDGSRDGEPSTGGIITDHKYAPEAEWWSRCRYCKLAQAAHAASEFEYYGDNIL